MEERRKIMPFKLDEEQDRMLREMYFILTDENVGLCKSVKKNTEAINGNGKIGLKAQVMIIWMLTALLGMESPIVGKAIKIFVK